MSVPNQFVTVLHRRFFNGKITERQVGAYLHLHDQGKFNAKQKNELLGLFYAYIQDDDPRGWDWSKKSKMLDVNGELRDDLTDDELFEIMIGGVGYGKNMLGYSPTDAAALELADRYPDLEPIGME